MSPEELKSITKVEPMLVTAHDVAKLLQVSLRSVWRMRSAGCLPMPVRVGSSVRWRIDEIRIWITEGCPSPSARNNEPRRK